jgi:hypothetical protein
MIAMQNLPRWLAAAIAAALVLGASSAALADVPPSRPLTHWLHPKWSPSGLSVCVAGLALSAAIVAAGLLLVRRRPASRRLVLGFTAAGVLLVAGITAQVYWERVVTRFRSGRPPIPRQFQPPPAPETP